MRPELKAVPPVLPQVIGEVDTLRDALALLSELFDRTDDPVPPHQVASMMAIMAAEAERIMGSAAPVH